MTDKHKASQSTKDGVAVAAAQIRTKKVVRRKPKGSMLQRVVYWLMMTLIIALVLYVAAEIGWTIYSHAPR